jgi:hypothetical protein
VAADAVCVSRLRGAGAIVLGKLSTHEFAIGGPSFDKVNPTSPGKDEKEGQEINELLRNNETRYQSCLTLMAFKTYHISVRTGNRPVEYASSRCFCLSSQTAEYTLPVI